MVAQACLAGSPLCNHPLDGELPEDRAFANPKITFLRKGSRRPTSSRRYANPETFLLVAERPPMLRQLRVEGHDFGPEAIAHLSPAMYAHVNRYGKYSFIIEPMQPGQLRPLRQPTPASP